MCSGYKKIIVNAQTFMPLLHNKEKSLRPNDPSPSIHRTPAAFTNPQKQEHPP